MTTDGAVRPWIGQAEYSKREKPRSLFCAAFLQPWEEDQ